MIQYYSRYTSSVETERVYGDVGVRLLYNSVVGPTLTGWVLSRTPIGRVASRWLGKAQDSPSSARRVQPFIEQYGIETELFEAGPFATFNEFFIRKFKPGARPFVQAPNQLAAFAEGRYFGYESIRDDQGYPVKGQDLSPDEMLGPLAGEWASKFRGGPLLIARLCPVDYHRFHFPDDGTWVQHAAVSGGYQSVNPQAITYVPRVFVTNERQVSIVETVHFGYIAYVEVGAFGVGKIVQSGRPGGRFKRGQEKGYFLFGGSTVIVIGQPGLWKPSADILKHSAEHREVFVRLGDEVGVRR